ncbi:hypothetical protein PG994_010458 [Apiospora phragmitis]|uniref:Uncharacterized protein n=1 Tax=Apiospora phragmitis TaxID=2905665 RepID=A0ABR1TQ65_9PEZI
MKTEQAPALYPNGDVAVPSTPSSLEIKCEPLDEDLGPIVPLGAAQAIAVQGLTPQQQGTAPTATTVVGSPVSLEQQPMHWLGLAPTAAQTVDGPGATISPLRPSGFQFNHATAAPFTPAAFQPHSVGPPGSFHFCDSDPAPFTPSASRPHPVGPPGSPAPLTPASFQPHSGGPPESTRMFGMPALQTAQQLQQDLQDAPLTESSQHAREIAFFHETLRQLDPGEVTPPTFIHILTKAAIRDPEIAMDIKRLPVQNSLGPESQAFAASVGYNRPPHMLPDAAWTFPAADCTSTGISLSDHTFPDCSKEPSPTPVANDNDVLPNMRTDKPVDFTWMVDRAEAELGWTGKYDKHAPIRRRSLAVLAASQIGSILKKIGGKMAKHGSFPNRVHILTAMREIIHAVLETPTTSAAGSEAQKYLGRYQSRFLAVVDQLTQEQKNKLKILEGGQ